VTMSTAICEGWIDAALRLPVLTRSGHSALSAPSASADIWTVMTRRPQIIRLDGHPPAQHAVGRVCPVCGAHLSRYNANKYCYLHLDGPVPLAGTLRSRLRTLPRGTPDPSTSQSPERPS
jgi:hypothetical protein